MTGKDFLIKYIQNHTSEEIYNYIKGIEKMTQNYTDSRQAFIDFLDDYDSLFIFPSINDFNFIKTEDGWIMTPTHQLYKITDIVGDEMKLQHERVRWSERTRSFRHSLI